MMFLIFKLGNYKGEWSLRLWFSPPVGGVIPCVGEFLAPPLYVMNRNSKYILNFSKVLAVNACNVITYMCH